MCTALRASAAAAASASAPESSVARTTTAGASGDITGGGEAGAVREGTSWLVYLPPQLSLSQPELMQVGTLYIYIHIYISLSISLSVCSH